MLILKNNHKIVYPHQKFPRLLLLEFLLLVTMGGTTPNPHEPEFCPGCGGGGPGFNLDGSKGPDFING